MSVPLLRVASRSVVVAVLAVGLWLGAAGRAWADPLNPLDFASLGAFPTAPGGYTINTGGTPTLTGPGGTTLTGVVSHGIAVFDFDAINVTSGETFTGTGSLPLALLSRTTATIAGTIDGSSPAVSTFSAPGGPGGGSGGAIFAPGAPGESVSFGPGGGPGGGGPGTIATRTVLGPPVNAIFSVISGSGGGGFGGPGGAGAPSGTAGPSGPGPLPGGAGGATYGDLARQLQGGSGGGSSSGPGGGGGGAIEIGAVGSLAISGSISANGGSLSSSIGGGFGGGGGGSGGGILLHADSVRLTGVLSAAGGDGTEGGFVPGPSGSSTPAGGGGGGGRVTILSGPGGFVESGATIDVAGGAGGSPDGGPAGAGGPGGAGVLVISAVPEPASLVLLGTGILGLLGLGGMRRRAALA